MLRRKPSTRTPTLLYVVALCFLAPLEAQERVTDDFVPVTDAMLRDPDPADWLMVHRTYDHHAYSPLDQINRENVGNLRLAWMRAMDNEGPQQLRPLVYDGVMYIAHPGSDHLQALDATTGDLIWDYRWEVPADLREYSQLGNRTRNLAIYGNHILHLTADAHLIAVDARTGELVIAGVSDLHLQILWERLKSRYGVEVSTQPPKIPYLETVSAKGDAQYRHKKQSGGSGEFAEVWLRVEPTERGAGLEFVNSIFGGSISQSYVQSVEKGITAMMKDGVIAGCEFVDIKVEVYDGKEHPVDSKDVAFQKAGRGAFKEAVKITLTPLLTSLTLLQYADIDSESEMLGYGIGVILLNIGMYFVAPAVLLSVCIRKISQN